MENVFMKEFLKRFLKGVILGVAMIAFMIIMPVLSNEPVMGGIEWYYIPLVMLVTLLYGTGWFFAVNLIKKGFIEFFRLAEYGSFMQAICSKGLISALVIGGAFIIVTSIAAVIVGNVLMIRDYLRARKGMEAVSHKYRFGIDNEYDREKARMDAIKAGVDINGREHNTPEFIREKNRKALDNIGNGISDSIYLIDEDSEGEKLRKVEII